MTLSSALNASSTIHIGGFSRFADMLFLSAPLNASSTTHFTATSTFGNLIRIEGTGTSTLLGRLSISATSTIAGYKVCTQQNKVCTGGAFSSSGGFTTLRTATDLVGIGTSTPGEKLSVNGGAFFDSDIIRFGSSSAPTLNFRYFASATSTIPNLTSAFTFATSTTNTPLLTLSTKSSRYGRIGIGTSSPSALFAINALNASNQADNIFYIGSSTQNTFIIDNHGNVGIGTSTRSTSKARLGITGFGTGTNRILALADANNVERFTVQENGNVGIGGATAPIGTLDLSSTADRQIFIGATSDPGWTVPAIQFTNSDMGALMKVSADTIFSRNVYYDGTYKYLEASRASRVRLGSSDMFAVEYAGVGTANGAITFSTGILMNSAGNVGIGTASPGAQLDLSTDSARKLTTTTWSTGSDSRIKTDIRSIEDGLGIIRQMRPVKYRYNADFLAAHPSVKDVDYYNFIAQEYQQVFPNSITETDGLLYLNNANMIPYAIAGIKELDEKVSQLSPSISSGQVTEGWTIDQTTGRLTTTYGLDLGGNSIQNVSAIVSASGNWRIDESGKLAVEELEVRGKGITVYDKQGEAGCVFVESVQSGAVNVMSGKCGENSRSLP